MYKLFSSKVYNAFFKLPNFRSSKIEIKHLKKKTMQRLNLQDMFRIFSIHLQLKDVYKRVTLCQVGKK